MVNALINDRFLSSMYFNISMVIRGHYFLLEKNEMRVKTKFEIKKQI